MKVSVVMPNFNHGRFIAQSIESVLDQSYKNIQLIIVDDASTDDSFCTIDSYKTHDKRVNGIIKDKNSGFCKTFQEGCEVADGEIIYGLASDDYIHSKDFLKTVVDKFKHNTEIGIVWAKTDLFYDTGEYFTTLGQSSQEKIDGREFLRGFLSGENFVAGYSAVFNRKRLDKIGGFQYDLGPQCDYFPNHAVPSVYGGIFIPEVMTHARIFRNGSNYSTNNNEMERIERHAEFEKRMRRLGVGGVEEGLWLTWRYKLIKDIAPNSEEYAHEYFKTLIGI